MQQQELDVMWVLAVMCAVGVVGPVTLGAMASAIGRRVGGLGEVVQGGGLIAIGGFGLAMTEYVVPEVATLMGCVGVVAGAAYWFAGSKKMCGGIHLREQTALVVAVFALGCVGMMVAGVEKTMVLALAASSCAVGLMAAAKWVWRLKEQAVSARWCSWALVGCAVAAMAGGLMAGMAESGRGSGWVAGAGVAWVGLLVLVSSQMVMAMTGIMVSELVKKKVEEEASTDYLSGALLRGEFMKRADGEVRRCEREDKVVGCLMIDVDHFKKINDQYGHQKGDEVLSDLGRKLKSLVRPYDVVGRYGGEEFCVILPGVSIAIARGIGERIRERVESSSESKRIGVSYTVSLGLCCMKMGSLTELIGRSDRALYLAKNSGRNKLEVVSGLVEVTQNRVVNAKG